MKSSWVCRDYQSGDEHQILTLYKEVNGKEMCLQHWLWKFNRNPSGKGIIKLLFDGNKLVGHYAVIPVNLQVGNRIVKASFSVNTMTHPEYERQGIFPYLAEQVYEKCQQAGISLVYGFPNNNSYYGFTQKLGWTGFGRISIWKNDLGSGSGSTPNLVSDDIVIHKIDRFDSRADLLWNSVKDNYNVIVPRTQEYLNWRFADHPRVAYPKYIVLDSNNIMLGYIVLKTYFRESEPISSHIVDMLCVPSVYVARTLVYVAYKYSQAVNVRDLTCWMPDNCFCAPILRNEGFVMAESATNFGVRVFNSRTPATRQPGNWHLTMGDSDVF